MSEIKFLNRLTIFNTYTVYKYNYLSSLYILLLTLYINITYILYKYYY